MQLVGLVKDGHHHHHHHRHLVSADETEKLLN
jgi:hypothetical protein